MTKFRLVHHLIICYMGLREAAGSPKGMKIADNLRPLCPSLVTAAKVSTALPFVIPSVAEGPAVLFPQPRPVLEMIFDRSAA
jgi:hypothetical protein